MIIKILKIKHFIFSLASLFVALSFIQMHADDDKPPEMHNFNISEGRFGVCIEATKDATDEDLKSLISEYHRKKWGDAYKLDLKHNELIKTLPYGVINILKKDSCVLDLNSKTIGKSPTFYKDWKSAYDQKKLKITGINTNDPDTKIEFTLEPPATQQQQQQQQQQPEIKTFSHTDDDYDKKFAEFINKMVAAEKISNENQQATALYNIVTKTGFPEGLKDVETTTKKPSMFFASWWPTESVSKPWQNANVKPDNINAYFQAFLSFLDNQDKQFKVYYYLEKLDDYFEQNLNWTTTTKNQIKNLIKNGIFEFGLGKVREKDKEKDIFKILKEINNIVKIENLVLKEAGNNFKTIPDEIENLKELETVDFSGNAELTEISDKLKVEDRGTINFENCKSLENIPQNIIDWGNDENNTLDISGTKYYGKQQQAKTIKEQARDAIKQAKKAIGEIAAKKDEFMKININGKEYTIDQNTNANSANKLLEEANDNLKEANNKIKQPSTDYSAAKKKADEAKEKAGQALKTANQVVEAAQEYIKNCQAAETAAEAAETAANDAEAKVNDAETKVKEAENEKDKANDASKGESDRKTAAKNAVKAANEALELIKDAKNLIKKVKAQKKEATNKAVKVKNDDTTKVNGLKQEADKAATKANDAATKADNFKLSNIEKRANQVLDDVQVKRLTGGDAKDKFTHLKKDILSKAGKRGIIKLVGKQKEIVADYIKYEIANDSSIQKNEIKNILDSRIIESNKLRNLLRLGYKTIRNILNDDLFKRLNAKSKIEILKQATE